MNERRSYVVDDMRGWPKVSGVENLIPTHAPTRRQGIPLQSASLAPRPGVDHARRAEAEGSEPRSEASRTGGGVEGSSMRLAEMFTTNAHQSQRLRTDEIDLFGLTHPGKKRTENEDHFL